MTELTERGTIPTTWPELQWPTPAQWLEWLHANPAAGQLVIAERVLADAETAFRCLLHNHDNMQAQLDALAGEQRDAAAEYRRGWNEALADLLRRFDEEFPREPRS